jgi:hypothetical protein
VLGPVLGLVLLADGIRPALTAATESGATAGS